MRSDRRPISELLSGIIDYRGKTPPKSDSGVPCISAANVKNGRIDVTSTTFVSRETYDSWTTRGLPNPGDVIITTEAPVGEVAEFPGDREYLLTRRVMALQANPQVLAGRYLLYALQSPQTKARLLSGDRGTTVPRVLKTDITSLEIPLPSLTEQKHIAHILGTLDDKIELNRRMNEMLEAIAQALFKSWFVDFDPVIDKALAAGNPIPEPLQKRAEARQALGDQRKPPADSIARHFPDRFVFNEDLGWIPEGWEQTEVGEVSCCFDKKRIPLSKAERETKKPGRIPYYGATSVMDYIDDWIFDDVYFLVGEDGSVVKEDGAPFTQYIWGKTWVNNHAHVLQGAAGVATEHLMLFMRDQDVHPYVTGAVQPKINQKNLNRIPFLKASQALNEGFGEKISPLFKRTRHLSEESQSLSALRDTLLPKLLSGELRIPDAERQVEEAL